MCGIAGIVTSRLGAADELAGRLRRMQAALRHRGPDDEGLFMTADRGRRTEDRGQGAEVSRQSSGSPSICGLVHTRLAILDLSPAGHQPMSTPDGRFTIVFNGEIYNFRALRAELERHGLKFNSQSDTEVLLRLYEREGADCLQRLRGMFAFAIWDEREQSCFLARDPLGIKPLYVAQVARGLVFASELRAVLASGLVARELDPAGVLGYFESGTVPEPRTLVRGVECLPAGHSLRWKRGQIETRSHWVLRFEVADIPPLDALVGQVRAALLDSIRHHFVSDVPVGVFLSGGIDSTAVVALARVAGPTHLRTFSISFDDPAFNEGDVAARTARHFGTRHTDWRLRSADGRELVERFVPRLDQPSIDGFNTFTVAELAHAHGMKVVLSGLGGDELFGGYRSFRAVPRLADASRWLGPLRPLARRALVHTARPQLRRVGGFLGQTPDLEWAYRTFRGIFAFDEAEALAAGYAGGTPAVASGVLAPQPTLQDQVSALELTRYLRNQLLRDSDVMSMAWGLELRVPFVDRVLVEALARVPAATRLARGKKLLLRAVPEVPEWVQNRPKRGFVFPLAHWLAADWGDTVDALSRRHGVRLQTWYQKWSVFVFEQWCALNGVAKPREVNKSGAPEPNPTWKAGTLAY